MDGWMVLGMGVSESGFVWLVFFLGFFLGLFFWDDGGDGAVFGAE